MRHPEGIDDIFHKTRRQFGFEAIAENVTIHHRSHQQCCSCVKVQISAQYAAGFSTPQHLFQLGQRTFDRAAPPLLTERAVTRPIGHEMGQDALLHVLALFGWRMAELRDQIRPQVAAVENGRLFIEPVQVGQHFEAESIFIRPMLVDRSFAYAGGFGDRIHAGSVDAAVSKQVESSLQNLAMGLRTFLSGHFYIWILENMYAPIPRKAAARIPSMEMSSMKPKCHWPISAPRKPSTP